MNLSGLILLYTLILITLYCALLWLMDYSSFNIPEYIGNTGYQTYTVAMNIIIILVLIVFQKSIIKQYPLVKTGKLILWSVLICLFSQAIYQFFRQAWILRNENNNKTSEYFISLGVSMIMSLFI